MPTDKHSRRAEQRAARELASQTGATYEQALVRVRARAARQDEIGALDTDGLVALISEQLSKLRDADAPAAEAFEREWSFALSAIETAGEKYLSDGELPAMARELAERLDAVEEHGGDDEEELSERRRAAAPGARGGRASAGEFAVRFDRVLRGVESVAQERAGGDSVRLKIGHWQLDEAQQEGVARLVRDACDEWGSVVCPDGWQLVYEPVDDDVYPVGRVTIIKGSVQINGRVQDATEFTHPSVLDLSGVELACEVIAEVVRQANELLVGERRLNGIDHCPSCGQLRPDAVSFAEFKAGSECPSCGHVEPEDEDDTEM